MMTFLAALIRPYLTWILLAIGVSVGAAGFYAYAWLQGQHAAQVRGLQQSLEETIKLLRLRDEIMREDRRKAQEAEQELEQLKAQAQEMADAMAKDPNSNEECLSARDVERLRQLFTTPDNGR